MPCNVPGGEECTDGTVCSETDPAATGAECVQFRTPRELTRMRGPSSFVGYSYAHGHTSVHPTKLVKPVEMPCLCCACSTRSAS